MSHLFHLMYKVSIRDYSIHANTVQFWLPFTDVILVWRQQISTLAGNLVPSYFAWEVLFTMAIIGLGLLLFALLIGNMQNFLQALGRRYVVIHAKFASVYCAILSALQSWDGPLIVVLIHIRNWHLYIDISCTS